MGNAGKFTGLISEYNLDRYTETSGSPFPVKLKRNCLILINRCDSEKHQ